MKEVKDHCMLNGVYGTIINFLLKKLSNLRKINSFLDILTGFLQGYRYLSSVICVLLFIAVIHRSPVLEILLSAVYVGKEQLLRGT